MHNLPAEAAARGLEIQTYPGWELRSRSSGGFDEIRGVCLHHTAGLITSKPSNDMNYMWNTAANRPVGNIYIARDGTVTLGAAGAANTQGAGGPIGTSRGVVPVDASNRYHIAIEASNNGVGEVWPKVQLDAYLKLVQVLCDVYGFDPFQDVIFHQTWAPDRKIDPAGPTPAYPQWGGTSGRSTWDLGAFRESVVGSNTPPPDMSDFTIHNPVRIADQTVGAGAATLPVTPHGYTPEGATGVVLTVTVVGNVPGYFVFWNGEGAAPVASNVNANTGIVTNNMVWCPLAADGTFKVYTPQGGSRIAIDQVGWYI